MSGNGSTPSPQGEFASIARELGRGALVTVMRGQNHGARMLVRVDGTTAGSLGDPELERPGRPLGQLGDERGEGHGERDGAACVRRQDARRGPVRSGRSGEPHAGAFRWGAGGPERALPVMRAAVALLIRPWRGAGRVGA